MNTPFKIKHLGMFTLVAGFGVFGQSFVFAATFSQRKRTTTKGTRHTYAKDEQQRKVAGSFRNYSKGD